MAVELLERIAQAYAHHVDAEGLTSSLREARLVVPMLSPTAAMSVRADGLTWVCAFTSRLALARFAAARGGDHREWELRTLRGAELLACGEGVAVDLGGERPMLFPAGSA